MLLAGDIGGTKTALAVYSSAAGPRAALAQAEFPSTGYPDLPAIVRVFLAQVKLPVGRACFAIAGPVIGGSAKTTNLPWLVDAAALGEELGFSEVHLLNDFEAIARAVPALDKEDLYCLNAGESVPGGAIAVIAPGTGLGEAFLTWDGQRYLAHASEGGHADFAPIDATQIGLLRYLTDRFDHVSFERVCSGIGIPHIYDYLRDSGYAPETPEIASQLASISDRTPIIVEAALHPAAPCRLCAATLDVFVSILAAEAGNLTLKVLATGGLYLGGGIPVRMLPALERASFMQAFRRKGRLGELLARVPVQIIVSPAALIGAATYGLELAAQGAE